MKQIEGQMEISGYISDIKISSLGCMECICKKCLYWWSGRCPYGGCHDDRRARENPYDKDHPDRPPRTAWSDWNKPGEQAHWCRGGTFYPIQYCEKFVKYKGCEVKWCLESNVRVYQDGYIVCSLVDGVGCKKCYGRFLGKLEE